MTNRALSRSGAPPMSLVAVLCPGDYACSDGFELERRLHAMFAEYRVEREWFMNAGALRAWLLEDVLGQELDADVFVPVPGVAAP
jgi:hypothetical protein